MIIKIIIIAMSYLSLALKHLMTIIRYIVNHGIPYCMDNTMNFCCVLIVDLVRYWTAAAVSLTATLATNG